MSIDTLPEIIRRVPTKAELVLVGVLLTALILIGKKYKGD